MTRNHLASQSINRAPFSLSRDGTGYGLRRTSELLGMDRKTVRRNLQRPRWLVSPESGEITANLVTALLVALRPGPLAAGTKRPGSSWRGLQGGDERTTWRPSRSRRPPPPRPEPALPGVSQGPGLCGRPPHHQISDQEAEGRAGCPTAAGRGLPGRTSGPSPWVGRGCGAGAWRRPAHGSI